MPPRVLGFACFGVRLVAVLPLAARDPGGRGAPQMNAPTRALGERRAKGRFGVIRPLVLALCLLAASRPALGGPIFLSGDDADDFAHCQGTACGNLYARALNTIVTGSTGGAGGILAVGVQAGRTAEFAL